MSATEAGESSSIKRKHEAEIEAEDSGEDDWIGPLPTDAAPAKKVKGWYLKKLYFCFFFFINEIICSYYNFLEQF